MEELGAITPAMRDQMHLKSGGALIATVEARFVRR